MWTSDNGWRFWWTDMNNQTVELGGLYMDPAYAKRAQQIMWNFADASNVVIRGGQGSGIRLVVPRILQLRRMMTYGMARSP